MLSTVRRFIVLYIIYTLALVLCVPFSAFIWYIRRKCFRETSVAGDTECLPSLPRSRESTKSQSITIIQQHLTSPSRINSSSSAKQPPPRDMLVVIIHPEQWNGGSDRCTVAMIRYFVGAGHRVVWLTTMIDEYWRNHRWEGVEIRDIGLNLHPGDWWSQNVALGWHLFFSDLNPDLIVIDHSASCVPLLKWKFPETKVLFYCHFPQQLVTPSRLFLYRWYSRLIGIAEEIAFEGTDVIMVNSQFTASQFHRVMPGVPHQKIQVVYPPCDVDAIVSKAAEAISRKNRPKNEAYIFLSMNRFWPEKRLDIIVEAAGLLKRKGFKFLVQLAGSVMPHIPESRIYYDLLIKMTKGRLVFYAKIQELNVCDVVKFVPSPTEEEKFELYRQCDSALYTPPNEHFGIVPIEALEQRRPVIVCDSGGPAETVIEDVTGNKISVPSGELLADAMEKHMLREEWPALDTEDGYRIQRARFDREFSYRGFSNHLEDAMKEMFPNQIFPPNIARMRALA